MQNICHCLCWRSCRAGEGRGRAWVRAQPELSCFSWGWSHTQGCWTRSHSFSSMWESSPVSVSSTAALRDNPSLVKLVKTHKNEMFFPRKCWWFNEKVALNNYVNLFLGLGKHLIPKGLLHVAGWDFGTFGCSCKEHKWHS